MKRTLADIRENLDHVGCDNETALEMVAEIERLNKRANEVALAWSKIDDAHNAEVAQLTAELTHLRNTTAGQDVIVHQLEAEIERLRAAAQIHRDEWDKVVSGGITTSARSTAHRF